MNKIIIDLIKSDIDLFLMQYTKMTLCHIINNHIIDEVNVKHFPKLEIKTDDIKFSKWVKNWGWFRLDNSGDVDNKIKIDSHSESMELIDLILATNPDLNPKVDCDDVSDHTHSCINNKVELQVNLKLPDWPHYNNNINSIFIVYHKEKYSGKDQIEKFKYGRNVLEDDHKEELNLQVEFVPLINI